ncbi:hypothetical protein OKA04_04735 [Luteolibacter flavescens]|uniref:BclA C-terminal domain-containing protein n=1 Tax=Luteolibacter flavescens TaxID=1859460 RepID=A0ABT3FKD7_9BACT|nr:hypothetical protein [Luteolibacter flavescens]MCW1884023.1 hypothetical protein [Luteolibacter flavescens]
MPIELNGAAESVVGPIRNALLAAGKGQPNAFGAKQTFDRGVSLTALALVDAANIQWDLALGGFAAVTLAGNRTLELVNLAPGVHRLRVTQGAGGSHTLAFAAGVTVRTPGGAAITLSTAVGAVDWLTILHVSGTTIDVITEPDFQAI